MVSFSVVSILLITHTFIVPFDRLQLIGLWLFKGQHDVINKRTETLLVEQHANMVRTVLALTDHLQESNSEDLSPYQTLYTQTGLYFAAQMLDDPLINERLTLIANKPEEQVDSRVKCQAQQLLTLKYEIIVYFPDAPKAPASRFVSVDNFQCE